MRANIALSLPHNPKALYLDEPTIGLDIVAKKRIREFIKEINRTDNATVILTTYDMSDIESLSGVSFWGRGFWRLTRFHGIY
jgi:ABC-2 type transport system ATP-binding protein